MKNQQVLLARRPRGAVAEDDFRLVETEVPPVGEGQLLTRVHWLSLDPYMRGRMDETNIRRVFVKLAHGSSASGVVALESGPRGQQAFTTVEVGAGDGIRTAWQGWALLGGMPTSRVRRHEPTRRMSAMTELDVEVADDPSSVGRSAAARGAPLSRPRPGRSARSMCSTSNPSGSSMRLAMKLA